MLVSVLFCSHEKGELELPSWRHSLALNCCYCRVVLALVHGDDVTLGRADVDLAWTADTALFHILHLVPVRDPADRTRQGEDNGEHRDRDTDCLQDNARVEVDVWIEVEIG